jgi:heme/copper-type cytochrome/quinol oxidase subunit 2
VLTIDLFTWWAISISWSIAFLIVAGLYLYTSSRAKHKEDTRVGNQLKAEVVSVSKNFIFVWILLGLLVFYIFSVQLGTGTLPELVFALGNIVVEALLVSYLFRNRDKTRRSR